MIQTVATAELAEVEAEIIKLEIGIDRQRSRVCSLKPSGVNLELMKQILQTFEAALESARTRRTQLLDQWPQRDCAAPRA